MHMMSRYLSPDVNNWAKWINGADEGSIDIDNDGAMPFTRGLIDLSQALSQRLGRQMSMMATYNVNYIGIRLVNADDTDDNDGAANFGGKIQFWSPTKHRINALQMAREVEKAYESTQIDADSFFLSTDVDYRGLRFNWDADDQVRYATQESSTSHIGDQYSMSEIFRIYSLMQGSPIQSNALWSTDGRAGFTEQIGWTASYSNYDLIFDPIPVVNYDPYTPRSDRFELNLGSNHISVLGGLLMIDVVDCSTDSPQAIDDDYYVEVTVGVSGWSDF